MNFQIAANTARTFGEIRRHQLAAVCGLTLAASALTGLGLRDRLGINTTIKAMPAPARVALTTGSGFNDRLGGVAETLQLQRELAVRDVNGGNDHRGGMAEQIMLQRQLAEESSAQTLPSGCAELAVVGLCQS